MRHYYILSLRSHGENYAVAATCVPADNEVGVGVQVSVRSRLQADEVPGEAMYEIWAWVEEVTEEYRYLYRDGGRSEYDEPVRWRPE
jgi:hypothetical protein